jgi:lysozyme
MSVNQATIDLIKRFEGCKLVAYQDIVGIWTIGYGTTAGADVGVKPAYGMTITQERAEDLLRQGVDKFANTVDALITAKINQNERGACVCLAYNIGTGAFSKSTVLRELNAGNKDKAVAAFRMWNKAGGEVIRGLVNRREAEIALFLTPVSADMHTVTTPEKVEAESVLAAVFHAIVAMLKGMKK